MKTEEQKKENAEKFLAELKELAKKYEAKHLSVCCELEEKFFGIVGAEIEGYGDFFEASLKVGRLYQSCREKVKRVMDEIESKKW
jgi:hypothetical protein